MKYTDAQKALDQGKKCLWNYPLKCTLCREAPGIILAGGDGLSCTICLGFRTGRAVKM